MPVRRRRRENFSSLPRASFPDLLKREKRPDIPEPTRPRDRVFQKEVSEPGKYMTHISIGRGHGPLQMTALTE